MSRRNGFTLGGLIAAAVFLAASSARAGQAAESGRTGREVYAAVCITCHGPDGRGGVNPAIEAIVKPPDFSDCAFANREPDRGFLAVAHDGGPARGFSPLMAPWSGTFTEHELSLAVGHIRTLCTDQRWPRGELNLPRPLVTAKAFPEDEAVVSTSSQSGSIVTNLIYERRFGPLNQFEVIVPIASDRRGGLARATGVGDIALEYKRTLAHSLARGNIVSVTGEVVLPTGNEARRLGGGTAVFEPFVTFGQVLPRNSFLQAQVGIGMPLKSGHDNEVFWRVALGRTFEPHRFGRLWTPMLELLAARPLGSGTAIEWDLLPGAQVTLNTRQHVRLAGGVRVPVTQTGERRSSVIVYLLWDWYEGGFFEGW